MNFVKTLTEARRRNILLLLSAAPQYEAGELVLYQALPGMGTAASAAAVAADLDFLAELGLVVVEKIDSLRLAKITQRGLDVAANRSQVSGVARPLPGE